MIEGKIYLVRQSNSVFPFRERGVVDSGSTENSRTISVFLAALKSVEPADFQMLAPT